MNKVIEWDGPPPTATLPAPQSQPSRFIAPIKLSLANFPNFSGDIKGQENYKTKMETSFHGGKAYNIITQLLKDIQGTALRPYGRRL
eukprot:7569148-Ditylum_brightwellii.AAC.1